MKILNNFTKILSVFAISMTLCGCTVADKNISQMAQIPNPWQDCNDNLEQAAKIAGFNFPLVLSNFTVRAMKDMVEITYPLDEVRYVTVRKSQEEINGGDNSGDYNKYPQNDVFTLDNGVNLNVRRNDDKIYVMYFGAESGYFSARCEQGMSYKEVEGIYKVIAEVEALKLSPEADFEQ